MSDSGLNIAEFFRQQTILWNEEQKCGYCWEFDMPLRESDAEESQIKTSDEGCCVRLMITNLSIQENRTTDPVTLLTLDYYETYTFDLLVLQPDIIDRQTYQELPYPISQSKWETILEPLRSCIAGNKPFDFCEIVGRDVVVNTSNWTAKIDYLSNNYTGWQINVSLKLDGNPYIIIPQV